MADIQIERAHALGLLQARKVAFQWAEQAGEKFKLTCTYEEGATSDRLRFSRAGVNGTLTVTEDSFALNAQLGFLLSVFKEEIEGKITRTMDALLRPETTAKNQSA